MYSIDYKSRYRCRFERAKCNKELCLRTHEQQGLASCRGGRLVDASKQVKSNSKYERKSTRCTHRHRLC